jgi:hypothetical protein
MVVVILAGLADVGILWHKPKFAAAQATPSHSSVPADGTKGGRQYREGVILSKTTGSFSIEGQRVLFHDADGSKLCCLENLMLQRVYEMSRDSDQEATWNVSGVISEYSGSYFLLVSEAVRSARPFARATK